MSCIDCEKVQESGDIAYVRWGKANIGLTGCDKHLSEILTILRENVELAGKMTVSKQPICRVLNKPVKTDLF